jgi:hypothetical protein
VLVVVWPVCGGGWGWGGGLEPLQPGDTLANFMGTYKVAVGCCWPFTAVATIEVIHKIQTKRA